MVRKNYRLRNELIAKEHIKPAVVQSPAFFRERGFFHAAAAMEERQHYGRRG